MDLAEALSMCDNSTGFEEDSESMDAWQRLIDSGKVWLMPAWYGRTARALIEAGKVFERS
jgi:hypothetical protein